jgi:hypothetical protein
MGFQQRNYRVHPQWSSHHMVGDHTLLDVDYTIHPPGSRGRALGGATARVRSLFQEPIGLLPPRSRSHQIHLHPGTALVVVRPYHYAHAQKAELEKQCDAMLQCGIIRPSTSAFSMLVLIKKSNGYGASA